MEFSGNNVTYYSRSDDTTVRGVDKGGGIKGFVPPKIAATSFFNVA